MLVLFLCVGTNTAAIRQLSDFKFGSDQYGVLILNLELIVAYLFDECVRNIPVSII